MVQPLPTLACWVGLFLLLPLGVGAREPYPSVGELVDALAQELGWPAAATTEEKILVLRAEQVIPASLTHTHPATPTVVMAMLQGLVQRARAHGEDAGEVVSALVRAAAASQAPIPTLQPEHSFFPPVSALPPAVPPESEVPQAPAFSVIQPFAVLPCVEVPTRCPKPRLHRKDPHGSPCPAPVREFPRTIFAPGESPAEKGAGIFPRQ